MMACRPNTSDHTHKHTHHLKNSNKQKTLGHESDELRARMKDLHRERSELLADQAKRRDDLEEQRARCHELQMLKFGQPIDLRLLDTVGVRCVAVDKLRAQLKEQERAQSAELKASEKAMAAAQKRLLETMRANTELLTTAVAGGKRRQEPAAEEERERAAVLDAEQRQHQQQRSSGGGVGKKGALVAQVTANAATLRSLQQRVEAFKRKDCHISSS